MKKLLILSLIILPINLIGIGMEDEPSAKKPKNTGVYLNPRGSFTGLSYEQFRDKVNELIATNNIDHIDTDSKTALMHAAFYGYEDIVELLVTVKANLDLQDRFGHTTLMLAIRARSSITNQKTTPETREQMVGCIFQGKQPDCFDKIIKILIDAGSDLSRKKSIDNYNAKTLAIVNGLFHIMKLIDEKMYPSESERPKFGIIFKFKSEEEFYKILSEFVLEPGLFNKADATSKSILARAIKNDLIQHVPADQLCDIILDYL